MSSIPRRLRKINFSEQEVENVETSEDGLQGPPEVDNILPEIPNESTCPIKIIWPNGDMRQIVGAFRSQFLSNLKGGQIIVGTDGNGVPNERSGSILSRYLTELAENSSIAPLHIPRWDNELFDPKKQEMIKLVEVKFVYPPETKQLTRDWILMTLAKKWRAYKSRLKKKYYNRNTRSLDEILKDVPRGVNEHQWHSLVGIWCQDSHTKICLKNSECAKQQKNSHTTGRKGHARFLKEMETERNGKVSKIELWDRAHKRKVDSNDSDNVNTIMDTTHVELSRSKLGDKEILITKDSEVSKSLLAKRTKLRGFYHDKYWSHVKVSQGMTFLDESEQENKDQWKLRAIGDNVENVMDEVRMMRAFMAKKFPGEDYRNLMEAAENDEVGIHGRADDTNIQHDMSNDNQKSPCNMHTSNTFQELLPGKCTGRIEDYENSSLPHENMITKEARPEICAKEHQGFVPREQITKKQPRPESYTKESYANSSLGRRRIIAMKANNENSSEPDEGCDVPSFLHKQPTNKLQDNSEVHLFSANPRTKNRVVAIGTLMSQDKTYVVGGNMLGEEYYGVLINRLTDISDEKLPRPYKDIETVRDAFGHVIAWPKFIVKNKKCSSNQTSNNLVNSGAKRV